MAKEPVKVDSEENHAEPYEIAPVKALKKVFGVEANNLLARKINEVSQFLWNHPDTSETEVNARLIRAIELYESLDASDGAEGMLAMQMVGTHSAALECLRRAALSDQTFAGRDMALKHAHKLMNLYTQQLATLNKHRGKGQQKVTVEHVTVEPGGQAIVGNVEAGRPRKTRDENPATLEHSPEMPMVDLSQKKTPSKKRSK